MWGYGVVMGCGVGMGWDMGRVGWGYRVGEQILSVWGVWGGMWGGCGGGGLGVGYGVGGMWGAVMGFGAVGLWGGLWGSVL